MAVLPTELENVPDHFLHQLEGLLDLGLDQGGEVDDSHIHLHTDSERKSTQQGVSAGLKARLQSACGNVVKRRWKKEQSGGIRRGCQLPGQRRGRDQHTGTKERREGRK